MDAGPKAHCYQPQHYFNYPFTLVSLPKKTFASKPIEQPSAFEVYCPISCKKVKVGASRQKQKEGLEFNTTASRWVSAVLNKTIKYLVNGHPPNKKDKKATEGEGWGFWVEVSDKGNYAIFNPYCHIQGDHLSLYTFAHIHKYEEAPLLPEFTALPLDQEVKPLAAGKLQLYLKQTDLGSFISTNQHFSDSPEGQVTLVHPLARHQAISLKVEDALKTVPALKQYWLHQLNIQILAEEETESGMPTLNLDQIYEGLSFALNLEEQLRAKLSTAATAHLLNEKLGYHPRLYSAISRLTSFINYGVTKHDTLRLAQLGFYNRSDVLQDLAYFEYPDIPIPSSQDPAFSSPQDLRHKMFPFSRLERQLPNSNVPLGTFLKALMHQQVSTRKLKHYETCGPYLICVDEENQVSVWSCRLFPLKLFSFWATCEQTQISKTAILTDEKQVNVASEKEDQTLASLFEEEPPKAAPVQAKVEAVVVPEQSMLQQMLQMGYGVNLIKKALVAVKNESVPAALDMIEQIMGEQKKRKVQKKTSWNCPICTFLNRADIDTCEMCGELYDYQQQAEKERQREQKAAAEAQALKEEEERKLAEETALKEKARLEQEEADRQRQLEQKQELLKKSELVATRLLFRASSPIDPFFVVQVFNNPTTKTGKLKVTRGGMNRQFFSRFYRVEDKTLTSFVTRCPFSLELSSFQAIASASLEQRQWGLALLEPLADNWGVVLIKELELDCLMTGLKVHGDHITLSSKEKTLQFRLDVKDTLEAPLFQLQAVNPDQIPKPQVLKAEVPELQQASEGIEIREGEQIKLEGLVSELRVQVLEHLPGGVWQPLGAQSSVCEVNGGLQGEVVINQLLPLALEHYEGSSFSSKHYSTTMLEKSQQLYISNYPRTSFTFRHLRGKPLYVESIILQSSTKRLQRIFSVCEGLIFTADQPSWFHLAKKRFQDFRKQDYEQWLTTKKARNDHRQFWEPVGYFSLDGQVQAELDYKRPAKYLFLLPTNTHGQKKKDEVFAIKIDFFGAKGRVEEDKTPEANIFKREGSSDCQVQLLKDGVPMDNHALGPKQWGHINSYHFDIPNANFRAQAPLSATTTYLYKFRRHTCPTSLRVTSKHSQRIRVVIKKESLEEEVDSSAIATYSELAKVQQEFSPSHLQAIAEKLPARQLLEELLRADRLLSSYEALIDRLSQGPEFRDRLLQAILSLVPLLINDEVELTERGFRVFMALYEKEITGEAGLAFSANTEALKRITQYVRGNRNPNYNLLRLQYAIEELVLEPAYFSKEYYRLVHPNYVQEEPRSAASLEPTGPVNCFLFSEQVSPYFYREWVDLQQEKKIQNIHLYVPKITAPAFRPKLSINVWAADDQGLRLIYSHYFHEELLVSLGIYGFKDSEIYKGERLNCLTISAVNTTARFLKIEYSFLLATSVPHQKYKDSVEKFVLVPLIDGESTGGEVQAESVIGVLKAFPQQPKHACNLERMPPCRTQAEGSRSMFEVHEFPVPELQSIKQGHKSLVDRITTNIMDENIVREAVKSIKISEYELNHKGLDFAYTYILHLMALSRKFPSEMHISVDLMLEMFDVLVVFEAGPIQRRTFAFLQDNYRRLSQPQRATFIQIIIDKYLATINELASARITERYSPLKILEKLQQFELLVANLFDYLQKTPVKALKILLVKLITHTLNTHGTGNLQLYNTSTGKYVQEMKTQDLVSISFHNCLWVIENVAALKEQVLGQSLDLLLMFLANDGPASLAESRPQAVQAFMEQVEVKDLWRLVFLTIKLKCEPLKARVNKLFAVVTANLTEKMKRSINSMLQQIVVREEGSLYVDINPGLSQELWMNHLQTTLQLVTVTKDSLSLDLDIALKLLELPLTPRLWSLALSILPRNDEVLLAIIKNFPKDYYNSLGKEITHFCVPLAGLRSPDSIHINWLDLVRQIRLEGKTLVVLFVEQLEKSSFGGREALTMATTAQLKHLEVACELAQLVVEEPLREPEYSEGVLRKLLLWYFLNKSKQKGASPATEKVLLLSQTVRKILNQLSAQERLSRTALKILLQIRRDGQVIERSFAEKRVPVHSSLTLNRRFSECFEQLLSLFMTTDEMSSLFTFELRGLDYLLRTMDIETQEEKETVGLFPADEELLINEKLLLATKSPLVEGGKPAGEIKEPDDLKEQEFASAVKLMPNLNMAGLNPTNPDWTVYKKGNKNKIVFLPMTEPAYYHEHAVYLCLNRTAEIRSIKCGFTAASYEFPDKLVATPSAVIVEASLDGTSFEPIGEMEHLQDDAYIQGGVQVWVLNCQRLRGCRSIRESVQSLTAHRAHYLKLIVKRPTVTFIEGGYSQLNGRHYNSLGCSLTFLSVTGDDVEKMPVWLTEGCKEISKRSALRVLSSLLSEGNARTMRRIANDEKFGALIKANFRRIQTYMGKYPEVMPQVVRMVGAGNRDLGDWIVAEFLKERGAEVEARILSQIILSAPDRAFARLSRFLTSILEKMVAASAEKQLEAGLIYAKEIHFIESFCKTLEESYDLGLSEGWLSISLKEAKAIIDIYDRKHSSPEIKSAVKLLVSLLHIKPPLKISEELLVPVMDIVWSNCTEEKSHFYQLMSALLVDRRASNWLRQNEHAKIDELIKETYASCDSGDTRKLKLQLGLLSQVAHHEPAYLRQEQVHIQLYNRVKGVAHQENEIVEAILKLMKRVVLQDQGEEKHMATLLYQDVELLVRRRDPFLQKLYVGLLGLEQEVMVSLRGLQLQSAVKKEASFSSKWLSKKQGKQLADRINKKYKYSLLGEINNQVKVDHQDLFLKAFSSNAFLMVMRFKVGQTAHTCGVYSPAPAKRNQEGDYFWQQILNYESTGFLFFLEEDPLFVTNESGDAMLGNIYGGDEEQENAAMFYDEGFDIFQFSFSTAQPTVPRISLTKYKEKLPQELTSDSLDNVSTYTFLGLELWELKVSNAVAITDSKLTNLLTNSNHARPPFSYYRTAPIYIFPANITIAKFMNILNVKGVCESHSHPVPPTTTLLELQQASSDFVVDLEIQSQEDDSNPSGEMGYIPVMNVFKHFSDLNGVLEVLKLGSESIKDWKKPDRKKNFEHYMDELRSFINLPSFFNLFIKNQQYVTLLFEVASGMPDDETSTRNWEQQYVSNFRYIYKIVSDIFKFDRSPALRDMDRYSDFAEVILEKLSHITKESARIVKEEDEPPGPSEPANNEQEAGLPDLAKVKSEDRKRKKKGIGYGADNQNNSKWSASEWLEARKNVSQETLRVINIIASFLDCQVPLKDTTLSDIIKESCLLPLLQSAVRSGSLLDISKEADLFKCYLQIVRLLAIHPSTIDCVLDLDKKYKPEQSESIYSLLGKLNGTATIFSDCLKSGNEEQSSSNEVAEAISKQIRRTYALVDKAVRDLKKRGKGYTIQEIDNMPIADAYRLLLSGLRFGHSNMKEGNAYKHAHAGSISSSSNPPTSKILRLSQQLADLSTSLPCEHTNSIFLRCDQSRIDVIQILIMGSKDTPYSNGAFLFDVYCDDSYPNNPPKMLITTTGQGKIRFNPNLYSCGKVCLSLLGTWRGSASENWDPKVSTLLQLFISTQGITMSDDVYFNEPGFEGEQGTEEGDRKNEAYSNIVRLGNVRYAMNGQIKNPPKGFQEVVRRHFYVKKRQILQECEKWVNYAEKRQASYNGLVNDHNSSWCSQLKQSKTKYKELLVKEIEELKKLLAELPPPNLKQEDDEPTFVAEKHKQKAQTKAVDAKLEEVDVQYESQQKAVKEVGENVLQDRWSRYIGAMGIEAVKKQAESSILLVGLKPLGLEIAKNLVLSGLKRLTIVESSKTLNNSEHFYMANIKSPHIRDCIFKIKELNPYMVIQHLDSLPDLKPYTAVVSTADYGSSRELAEQARAAGVKFIYAETKGVSGIYFADLGTHQVNDPNGEESFEGIIKNISNQEEGLVTLLDGVKHPYEDGDYVVLSLVEGMDVLQETIEEKTQAQLFFEEQSKEKAKGINNRVFKIKVVNWNSFRIGDTRNFSPYKSNGLCRNLKVPRKHNYDPLSLCEQQFDKYLDPSLGVYDFEKMGDNLAVFLCFRALSQLQQTTKTSLPNWSPKDTKALVEVVEKAVLPLGKSEQQVKGILKFANNFGLVAEAELPTIGAYLGGIVSQEVIKAITNKYMPIKQFFTFHFGELLQKVPQQVEQIEKLRIDPSEDFSSLKMVVGREGAVRVQELKTFVIGAGAIGCQLLKNFAMINMGAKGEIVVTDPDHIETSNLSRQFLFRDKHVKKAKSATACATLLQLNPRLEGKLHARLDKVCEETEDIYSNAFFKTRGAVANALDNVRARQYVDKRCVENKVALFESGTLGPKGHVQVIVPFKTENYGSQNDPSEESQIPHCTLKMFPEETVHCIEWARDIFGKLFTLNPKALKKVIEAKDLKVLEGQERETAAKMIKHRPESFDDCIAEAVRKFYAYYRNNVRQLLYTYPLDMKNKEGKPFWALPKRPPKQINELDFEDEVHRTFVSAYAVILARTYSLPYPKNFRSKEGRDPIMKAAIKVKVEDFVPNAEAAKAIEKEVEKENEKDKQSETQPQEESPSEKPVSEEVELTQEVLQIKPVAEEFEKDQDQNGHIDLIYSMSSLRCRNYGLSECSWIEAKLKAGKILAALSTTTSVVSALQTLEMLKLVTGSTIWRNGFVNLAVPIVQITEPGPPAKHPIGNTAFTVWDEWVLKASTLSQVQQQLKDAYEVEAFNISSQSGQPIYWEAMYADKEEAREKLLQTKLSSLFEEKVIELSIAMRKVGSSEPYEHVPKVKVEVEE